MPVPDTHVEQVEAGCGAFCFFVSRQGNPSHNLGLYPFQDKPSSVEVSRMPLQDGETQVECSQAGAPCVEARTSSL